MQSNLPPFQGKNSRQYLPRKGTETRKYPLSPWKELKIYSRQYLPRKGTETRAMSSIAGLLQRQNSRQYLPRKGTETEGFILLVRRVTVTFPTIFTPQGDGNNFAVTIPINSIAIFPTIFTPQGDGNRHCNASD